MPPAVSDVVDDGLVRCPWAGPIGEYRDYHDLEWGRPVGDDNRVYEKLCLEGFQAGLSWITVLRKRPAFREAFAVFDPAIVATFSEADVQRLLNDSGIIRHRGKIEATISNARAALRMVEDGISLAGLVWSYRSANSEPPVTMADLPGSTAESKALSAELRRRGFKFVGPTTVYAAMQSLGVINDHLADCHFRTSVEEDMRSFEVPPVALAR